MYVKETRSKNNKTRERNMERRSFSSPMHEQSEVRSLKAEIANLKELIARITDESQKQISALKSKILYYESHPLLQEPPSPTKKEKELIKEITQLKKIQAEENTKLNTDAQKEISSLRYQIAEFKNCIAKQDAANAQLTLENIALQTKLSAYEDGGPQLMQDICHKLDDMELLFNHLTNRLQGLVTEVKYQRNVASRNEKAVDYLARSLSLISDLPQNEMPTAMTFIKNPETLISFVDKAETTIRQQKKELQIEIYQTSKTLASTMLKAQQPPLSRPVARALTNLGEVILDVTEQMNEDHMETMKILSSDYGTGSSNMFLDNLNYSHNLMFDSDI